MTGCIVLYNNNKNILQQAINSFLMQETDFPFEVVIGEDCSTDNTRKIVEKYKEMYPNIIKLIVILCDEMAIISFLL